jgi:hypothetical protein
MMAQSAQSGDFHLATVAYRGRIWDAYLEIEEDARHLGSHRGRLRFDSPDGGAADGTYRTAAIIIEPSYEEAVAKARTFDDRQLQGLLRSVLPEEEDEGA